MTYNESGEAMYVDHFTVENGRLNAYYKEGDNMAKVDLGNVVGPQGAKGDTGPQGIQGEPLTILRMTYCLSGCCNLYIQR